MNFSKNQKQKKRFIVPLTKSLWCLTEVDWEKLEQRMVQTASVSGSVSWQIRPALQYFSIIIISKLLSNIAALALHGLLPEMSWCSVICMRVCLSVCWLWLSAMQNRLSWLQNAGWGVDSIGPKKTYQTGCTSLYFGNVALHQITLTTCYSIHADNVCTPSIGNHLVDKAWHPISNFWWLVSIHLWVHFNSTEGNSKH